MDGWLWNQLGWNLGWDLGWKLRWETPVMQRVALGLCPSDCSMRGTCRLVGGFAKCFCRKGWTGAACETATAAVASTVLPSTPDSSILVPILLVALLSLLVLCLAAVVVYLMSGRRSVGCVDFDAEIESGKAMLHEKATFWKKVKARFVN
ncbi:hypothetical protein GCK72_012394 [Caenorhabditis remanei]|uniref:EGF-like domain-containing protein n=1 Tax=Caenorhabditis remanei TaxID=31234 RepID=A0A6A5GMV5_CAERE|nr:hypothetical protein GCK72_012394 [Caenorhabditis remanei]KAF1755941.1 hypothetical protein GCK72_012394 [Caenorhabditis remanei]